MRRAQPGASLGTIQRRAPPSPAGRVKNLSTVALDPNLIIGTALSSGSAGDSITVLLTGGAKAGAAALTANKLIKGSGAGGSPVTADSITDSGSAVTVTVPTAISSSDNTATPATLRVIHGQATLSYAGSATVSGSVVSVRGNTNLDAATTIAGQSYIYGTQGKITAPGTFDGSAWVAGLVGQVDVNGATLTSASHVTPLWSDFGATGPSVTCSFCDLFVGTNTTATTINSIFYGYAKTSYVFDLGGPAALALSTSGSSAGNCAQTGGVVFAKAMAVKVDGTNYWIPLCTAL